jgi:hypothetical protein
MATQFITNNKGEKTAVIIPVSEYEDLLHQHHLNLDLTDGYKTMMDTMLEQENSGKGEYISFSNIKERFQHK